MGRPSEADFLDSQLTGDATRLSISGSNARTSALSNGMYWVTCDVDCRIKQGGSAVTATSTTGTPLWAKTYISVYVDGAANSYVASVANTGTGTLELIPVVA